MTDLHFYCIHLSLRFGAPWTASFITAPRWSGPHKLDAASQSSAHTTNNKIYIDTYIKILVKDGVAFSLDASG